MAILQCTAQLKLRDDEWKTLRVDNLTADAVTCSGLVEGTDFEIDRPRGFVRRLRPMLESEQGLFTFTFGYDDKSEQQAADQAADSNLKQQLVTQAQSAVGVLLSDLTAAQRNALVATLLYKAGALTSDLKIKPLGQWVNK